MTRGKFEEYVVPIAVTMQRIVLRLQLCLLANVGSAAFGHPPS